MASRCTNGVHKPTEAYRLADYNEKKLDSVTKFMKYIFDYKSKYDTDPARNSSLTDIKILPASKMDLLINFESFLMRRQLTKIDCPFLDDYKDYLMCEQLHSFNTHCIVPLDVQNQRLYDLYKVYLVNKASDQLFKQLRNSADF
ncbi:MAG: hypothetical protein JHC93_02300 [Parachlamydiales bacterium]|nr:hypothetical protein [Parachlamydiales bacterium]